MRRSPQAAARSRAGWAGLMPRSRHNWSEWGCCCMNSLAQRTRKSIEHLIAATPSLRAYERSGSVSASVGLTVDVDGLACAVGEHVLVEMAHGKAPVLCEVVGFRGSRTILMPFGDPSGIHAGARAV